jgi:hypothetical protein
LIETALHSTTRADERLVFDIRFCHGTYTDDPFLQQNIHLYDPLNNKHPAAPTGAPPDLTRH